ESASFRSRTRLRDHHLSRAQHSKDIVKTHYQARIPENTNLPENIMSSIASTTPPSSPPAIVRRSSLCTAPSSKKRSLFSKIAPSKKMDPSTPTLIRNAILQSRRQVVAAASAAVLSSLAEREKREVADLVRDTVVTPLPTIIVTPPTPVKLAPAARHDLSTTPRTQEKDAGTAYTEYEEASPFLDSAQDYPVSVSRNGYSVYSFYANTSAERSGRRRFGSAHPLLKVAIGKKRPSDVAKLALPSLPTLFVTKPTPAVTLSPSLATAEEAPCTPANEDLGGAQQPRVVRLCESSSTFEAIVPRLPSSWQEYDSSVAVEQGEVVEQVWAEKKGDCEDERIVEVEDVVVEVVAPAGQSGDTIYRDIYSFDESELCGGYADEAQWYGGQDDEALEMVDEDESSIGDATEGEILPFGNILDLLLPTTVSTFQASVAVLATSDPTPTAPIAAACSSFDLPFRARWLGPCKVRAEHTTRSSGEKQVGRKTMTTAQRHERWTQLGINPKQRLFSVYEGGSEKDA
ncbi:hypothetical protein BDZ90DRAFT_267170, partial [Jaminaea rosea]